MCTCQINLQFRTHPTCVPCDLSSQRVQMSYGVTHRDIVCLPRQVLMSNNTKCPPATHPSRRSDAHPSKPTHHYKFYAEWRGPTETGYNEQPCRRTERQEQENRKQPTRANRIKLESRHMQLRKGRMINQLTPMCLSPRSWSAKFSNVTWGSAFVSMFAVCAAVGQYFT